MTYLKDLKNKVIVVTGGAGASAGNTGAEIVRKLCMLDAKVAIWDIADQAGITLCDELKSMGKAVYYIHCDVTKAEDVQKACRETVDVYGGIDGLVNNAFWHADVQPPLHEATLEDWDAHMDINLRCHFIVCKYVIPELLKQKNSVILNIGSTGAHRGEDGYYAYDAAKAGLESLTRNIAAQYGRNGIRCNCLVPGLMLNAGFDAFLEENEALKAVFSKMDRNNLLYEGHGNGKQAADAAIFLLSDMSAFMTAQIVVLDGGNISQCPQRADMHASVL